MNKNLFEILIQRDFKPFDVRFLFPPISLADHHAPSSSPTDGFLSRKNAQLWYHPHGHQARYPFLPPFHSENVMFYPLDDGRPVDSATVPVPFSLSLSNYSRICSRISTIFVSSTSAASRPPTRPSEDSSPRAPTAPPKSFSIWSGAFPAICGLSAAWRTNWAAAARCSRRTAISSAIASISR